MKNTILDTFFNEISDDDILECIFCNSNDVIMPSNYDDHICESCGLWQLKEN